MITSTNTTTKKGTLPKHLVGRLPGSNRQALARQVERIAHKGVSRWLKRNEDHPLIENMKDLSTGLLRRLCRNEKFNLAVETGDQKAVRGIIATACWGVQRIAYRPTQTDKAKRTDSSDRLLSKGFDVSFVAYNDNQELTGMPSNPLESIEWVCDDELVRCTSRYHPKVTEKLLSLELLNRQVIILYWTTKYSAKAIAEMLKISSSKVTNIAHRDMKLLREVLNEEELDGRV